MVKKTRCDDVWNVAVGRNIEAARKRAKMTCKGLAQALGISQQRLYWYEAGQCSCPARILHEIAGELCIDVRSLMPNTRCSC